MNSGEAPTHLRRPENSARRHHRSASTLASHGALIGLNLETRHPAERFPRFGVTTGIR